MFCINCGKKLPDDAKFCSGCGKRVETKEEKIINTVPICSSCGEELKPGNKFCIKCGQPVEESKNEEKHTSNGQVIFTPTNLVWFEQIPEDSLLDENLSLSFKYISDFKALDFSNLDNWIKGAEILVNIVDASPLLLNSYWDRGLYLTFLFTTGITVYSSTDLNNMYKIVNSDMTTLINALPPTGNNFTKKSGICLDLIGHGVLFYLRAYSQMLLDKNDKDKIRADLEKALELGIGYNGKLFGFIAPELKQKTEEEHARQLLYVLEHGFFKSLFKKSF
ncbi:MAG: zinc ribbon domain-containing protein [Bacteroidetes bacterium]|nr:zinc ribbon domain-containing protein [Bacteroidota bacterium]